MSTLVIGIGGPTSSGKTTLAKHIYKLLADHSGIAAALVHQDDYALAEERLPWHEEGQFRDWDAPVGSIDYARMTRDIKHFRTTGEQLENLTAHDHLNVLPDLPISKSLAEHWRKRFADLLTETGVGASGDRRRGQPKRILIADGFLLYYDAALRAELDLRFFMRVTRETIKRRRDSRGGYNTAEGQLWQDPPNYFDLSLWPNYVKAHQRLFEAGDVEHGKPVHLSSLTSLTNGSANGDAAKAAGAGADGTKQDPAKEDGAPVEDLVVMSGEDDSSMESLVLNACKVIEKELIRLGSSSQELKG